MSLISNVYQTAVSATYAKRIGKFVWEKAEPVVANYIDNLDVTSRIEKKIADKDTKSFSEEEQVSYKSAGNTMAKLAENIAKYGDAASDDKTIKGALFRMAGRIGEVAQENPEAAGFYVSSSAIGAKQLLSAATYVNNKIESSEAKGETITPEQLLSWGKQGAALQAVSTVVNTVETVMPESDAKDTKKDSEQTTADTTKNMTNAEKTAYFSQLADDALHVDDLVSGSAETSLQQVE